MVGFNEQDEQEEWIMKCIEIVKEFDEKMSIPIQFHIRTKNYKHGSNIPTLVDRFLNIINELPETAYIIWHGYSFGWDILETFLKGGSNRFVTFCARNSDRLKYLEVYFFF